MLRVDLGRMGPPRPRETSAALAAMEALEAGAVANPSEGRQVGHYWLRSRAHHGSQIEAMHRAVDAIDSEGFTDFLLCGIGGSALGPQLLADALPIPGLRPHFLDNTDPVGLARSLDAVDPSRCLVLVFSKSGGTRETRNSLAEVLARGVDMGRQGIAVTVPGSTLHEQAADWRARIPIWDWVGGRTSITDRKSVV